MFKRVSATKGKRLSRYSEGVYFMAPVIYVTFGLISSICCYTVMHVCEESQTWGWVTCCYAYYIVMVGIYRCCFCYHYYGYSVCRLRSGYTRVHETSLNRPSWQRPRCVVIPLICFFTPHTTRHTELKTKLIV